MTQLKSAGSARIVTLTRFLLTGLLCLAAGAAAQIREAEDLVAQTTDRMLVLIEEAKSYVDEDPERFYSEVETLLRPVIDFPRFARSVMAAHYRDATPEQRERFAEGFKWTLVRTYALALTEFNDGQVTILPSERPPRRPDRASVKQEIRSGGDVYPVVYSMVQSKDGEWRLRNMIINGINMGLTYRNQFASAVNDPQYGGDMDRIIDGWIASLGDDGDGGATAADDQAAASNRVALPDQAAASTEAVAIGTESGNN
jgi:phospholipid transport system substrate-binding protein